MKKYLVATSANIDENFDFRKSQYEKSFNILMDYENVFDDMFLIENCKYYDYLGQYFNNITVLDNTHSNKGVNEFVNIGKFLNKHRHLEDDSFIFKLTGRYEIISEYFIDLVNDEYDIFYKNSQDIFGHNDKGAHTSFFAIRKSLLMKFISLIDINNNDPIEWFFMEFCKQHNSFDVNRLGILSKPYEMNRNFII